MIMQKSMIRVWTNICTKSPAASQICRNTLQRKSIDGRRVEIFSRRVLEIERTALWNDGPSTQAPQSRISGKKGHYPCSKSIGIYSPDAANLGITQIFRDFGTRPSASDVSRKMLLLLWDENICVLPRLSVKLPHAVKTESNCSRRECFKVEMETPPSPIFLILH